MEVISTKSKKRKGKRSESTTTSTGVTHDPDHQHHHDKATELPLPHEEEAGPSGFGTANVDYNTLTEEYLEAAENIGYDGKVKDVENEGPLVEGSKAWEEAHEEEAPSETTTPLPADATDEFRNPWER